MDPLVVIAIALAVFAAFVLVTAYILKSARMFRPAGSMSDQTGKAYTGQAISHEDEEADKKEKKSNAKSVSKK